MSIKMYLEGLYDYNDWANHRYLKAAEALQEEQLHRNQDHTATSIHTILLHMLSTETIWLKRWQGGAPKEELSPDDFPTLLSIRENWAELEKEVRRFLVARDDESLQADMVCIGFNGKTFHLPLWQMMAHVPNHNTHHRSELAVMFISMNIPYPEDETVQFFLIRSGQRKE